jgi:hypothetical protein
MSYHDFLFVTPSFSRGFSRAIDFWGASDVYNVSATPETADAIAMWSDWKTVGADLLEALRQFNEEQQSKAA